MKIFSIYIFTTFIFIISFILYTLSEKLEDSNAFEKDNIAQQKDVKSHILETNTSEHNAFDEANDHQGGYTEVTETENSESHLNDADLKTSHHQFIGDTNSPEVDFNAKLDNPVPLNEAVSETERFMDKRKITPSDSLYEEAKETFTDEMHYKDNSIPTNIKTSNIHAENIDFTGSDAEFAHLRVHNKESITSEEISFTPSGNDKEENKPSQEDLMSILLEKTESHQALNTQHESIPDPSIAQTFKSEDLDQNKHIQKDIQNPILKEKDDRPSSQISGKVSERLVDMQPSTNSPIESIKNETHNSNHLSEDTAAGLHKEPSQKPINGSVAENFTVNIDTDASAMIDERMPLESHADISSAGTNVSQNKETDSNSEKNIKASEEITRETDSKHDALYNSKPVESQSKRFLVGKKSSHVKAIEKPLEENSYNHVNIVNDKETNMPILSLEKAQEDTFNPSILVVENTSDSDTFSTPLQTLTPENVELVTIPEKDTEFLSGFKNEPILLFSSSGELLCISSFDGHIQWRLPQHPILVPFLSVSHSKEWIVELQSGGYLYYQEKSGKWSQFPLTIREICNAESPLKTPEGFVMFGEKSMKMFTLNVQTGVIQSADDGSEENIADNVVVFGRADYVVTIKEGQSGENIVIKYSEMTSLFEFTSHLVPQSSISIESVLSLYYDIEQRTVYYLSGHREGHPLWKLTLNEEPIKAFEWMIRDDESKRYLYPLTLSPRPLSRSVLRKHADELFILRLCQRNDSLFILPDYSSDYYSIQNSKPVPQNKQELVQVIEPEASSRTWWPSGNIDGEFSRPFYIHSSEVYVLQDKDVLRPSRFHHHKELAGGKLIFNQSTRQYSSSKSNRMIEAMMKPEAGLPVLNTPTFIQEYLKFVLKYAHTLPPFLRKELLAIGSGGSGAQSSESNSKGLGVIGYIDTGRKESSGSGNKKGELVLFYPMTGLTESIYSTHEGNDERNKYQETAILALLSLAIFVVLLILTDWVFWKMRRYPSPKKWWMFWRLGGPHGTFMKNENELVINNGVLVLYLDQILGYGSHGTIVYKGVYKSPTVSNGPPPLTTKKPDTVPAVTTGRPVAIKRLLVDFYSLAEHEIQMLQHSDTHSNIIRYYTHEISGSFLYIALDLCPASLLDIVSISDDPSRPNIKDIRNVLPGPKALLKGFMEGLQYLHSLGIIHRDIKPANILISKELDRLLLSDFGLCKKVFNSDLISTNNERSFTRNRAPLPTVCGTIGWRPPEMLLWEGMTAFRAQQEGDSAIPTTTTKHNNEIPAGVRQRNVDGGTLPPPPGFHAKLDGVTSPSKIPTKSTCLMDIFSAGCLIYYLLTEGRHPFEGPESDNSATASDLHSSGNGSSGGGLVVQIEYHIIKGEYDLRYLERLLDVFYPLAAASSTKDLQRCPSFASVNSTTTNSFNTISMIKSNPGSFVMETEEYIEGFTTGLTSSSIQSSLDPKMDHLLPSSSLSLNPQSYLLQKESDPCIPEALDLIRRMICKEEQGRPNISQVLNHPYFWSCEKRLAFLQDVSDRLHVTPEILQSRRALSIDSEEDKAIAQAEENHFIASRDSLSRSLQHAWRTGLPPPPSNWLLRLDPILRSLLSNDRRRKYHGGRVIDLLRALRNKRHHYQDLPLEIRTLFGSLPDGFLNYWIQRFPSLVMVCWNAVFLSGLLDDPNDPVFKPYYT